MALGEQTQAEYDAAVAQAQADIEQKQSEIQAELDAAQAQEQANLEAKRQEYLRQAQQFNRVQYAPTEDYGDEITPESAGIQSVSEYDINVANEKLQKLTSDKQKELENYVTLKQEQINTAQNLAKETFDSFSKLSGFEKTKFGIVRGISPVRYGTNIVPDSNAGTSFTVVNEYLPEGTYERINPATGEIETVKRTEEFKYSKRSGQNVPIPQTVREEIISTVKLPKSAEIQKLIEDMNSTTLPDLNIGLNENILANQKEFFSKNVYNPVTKKYEAGKLAPLLTPEQRLNESIKAAQKSRIETVILNDQQMLNVREAKIGSQSQPTVENIEMLQKVGLNPAEIINVFSGREAGKTLQESAEKYIPTFNLQRKIAFEKGQEPEKNKLSIGGIPEDFYGMSSAKYGEVSQSGVQLRTSEHIAKENYPRAEVSYFDFKTGEAKKPELSNSEIEKLKTSIDARQLILNLFFSGS